MNVTQLLLQPWSINTFFFSSGHKSSNTGFLHEVSGFRLRHEVRNLALAGCSELSCCFLPFEMASCEGLGIWLGCLESEVADIARPAGRSPGGQHKTGSVMAGLSHLALECIWNFCWGQNVLMGIVAFGISCAACWHSSLVIDWRMIGWMGRWVDGWMSTWTDLWKHGRKS